MRYKKPLRIFWALLVGLLLTGGKCTDVTVSTKVDKEQKISDTAGSFNGNLSIGDQFGSAIANIGDLEGDGVTDLAVGAPFDDDNGTDRGAVWILFMDDNGHVDLEQKISEDKGNFQGNLHNDDRFGSSVAGIDDLDGDGVLDLAVGAPLDDDGGTDRGAVWILFLNTDGTVRQTQKIADSTGGFDGNLDDGDHFGQAITNIGDLNSDGITDLAVTAPYDDDQGTDRGAVWILFMNTDGTVDSTQKISAKQGKFDGNLDDGDHFGSAIAGLGDINNDGTYGMAVGADQDDDGGLDRGAIWVLFLNTDGTVADHQKISQSNGNFSKTLGDGDGFGNAIANIGDLDADGTIDLAVGAHQSDDGGINRGAVWILFLKNTGEVNSATKISATNGNFNGTLADQNRFGGAVAGIGDLNGDGLKDLAAGAPGDDDGGTDSGAIWMLFTDQVKTQREKGIFVW